MYKLTRLNGTDFYSGTINYAENIGKIIRLTDYDPKEMGECGCGLHSCKNPNDCFVGANIPCRAFKVKTIDVIVRGKYKTRSQGLKIIEEIIDLNKLFGWNYNGAINPINPFKLIAPEVNELHIKLLREWIKVRDSVWDSVWNPVRNSVRNSVKDSVWDSTHAYIGSFFTNITNWQHIKHDVGIYPFQSAVDLWKMGFVPSFDGKLWRLHVGRNAKIVWTGKL